MISNIELIGLDEDVLKKLYDNLDDNELLNLGCSYLQVKENIEYLKSFGIENIDELILYKSYVFLKTKDELTKAFSKVNIPAFVKIVNDDCNFIDEIF